MIQTYNDHSVEGRRWQRFAPGGLALRDLGPGSVVANDGRGVRGQLVVGVAADGDVLAVLDGTPDRQVDRLPHLDLGHDASGEALRQRVRPSAIGLNY